MLFLLIGLGAFYIGSTYSMGTPQRPGTGVLPGILAWCLIGSGLLLAIKAFFIDGPEIEAVRMAAACDGDARRDRVLAADR
ncbi:MAG: hypothetical protein R3D69_16925 [Xanthobacteraceae bacterium]